MSSDRKEIHPDDFGDLGIGSDSPMVPVYLDDNDSFRFDCHPGISCFNACCRNIDIVLTPYDVLRLKNNLGISTTEFIANFALFYEVDAHGLPGLKLKTRSDMKSCVFLSGQGCTVYGDRPTACRYYALGNLAMRKTGSPAADIGYFIVREEHCKGHDEDREQSIGEYRASQGLLEYDDMNLGFQELVLKKKSSGPTVGTPSPRSLQLYFMAAYDMDRFREFLQSDGFVEVFDLPEREYREIIDNEQARMRFSHRFLRQVLYGEVSIPLKKDAAEARLRRKRARRQAETHGVEEGSNGES